MPIHSTYQPAALARWIECGAWNVLKLLSFGKIKRPVENLGVNDIWVIDPIRHGAFDY
jgi:hypothetical protein